MLMELSKQELEILNYLIAGNTYTDIAKLTGISKHTVKAYAVAILRKLNLPNSFSLKDVDINDFLK